MTAPRPASTPQHSERIRCPQCGSEQRAVVLHTEPFWSYVHPCDCGYWIGESEWERVRYPAGSNP